MTPDQFNIVVRLFSLLLSAAEGTYALAPSFVRPKLMKVRAALDEAKDLIARLKAP